LLIAIAATLKGMATARQARALPYLNRLILTTELSVKTRMGLKCYGPGILTAMRLTTSALSLLAAAALVGGCDSVPAPKPDTHGDAAFLSQARQLCSAMPSLLTLDTTGSAAALASAANANGNNVANLQLAILGLTPSLSDASPLAPTITDLEQMLGDMAFRYQSIATMVTVPTVATTTTTTTGGHHLDLARQIALASIRTTQAIADLGKLGITSCLHQ
jgi:hypothetical protein